MAGLLILVNWLCNAVWANGLVFMHVGLYPAFGCSSGACVSPSRSRLCYLSGAPLWPHSGLYFWDLFYRSVSSNIYFFTFKSQIINLEALQCEIYRCTLRCSDQWGLFTYSHPDRIWNIFSQWYRINNCMFHKLLLLQISKIWKGLAEEVNIDFFYIWGSGGKRDLKQCARNRALILLQGLNPVIPAGIDILCEKTRLRSLCKDTLHLEGGVFVDRSDDQMILPCVFKLPPRCHSKVLWRRHPTLQQVLWLLQEPRGSEKATGGTGMLQQQLEQNLHRAHGILLG